MCVVSNVGDHYSGWLPNQHPWINKYTYTYTTPTVTREEFEALKKDVEECKRLLLAAKEIDEVTGQPDCETEEKLQLIRKLAEIVGVDLEI